MGLITGTGLFFPFASLFLVISIQYYMYILIPGHTHDLYIQYSSNISRSYISRNPIYRGRAVDPIFL